MFELTQSIPDADVLLALEPEELGGKLLFLLRKRAFQRNMFSPSNLNQEVWPQNLIRGQETPYPSSRREAIDLALAEAWAWLEAQGLVVPAADTNGANGWRVLTRRARRFESEAEFSGYAVARMLPRAPRAHPKSITLSVTAKTARLYSIIVHSDALSAFAFLGEGGRRDYTPTLIDPSSSKIG